MTADRTSRRRDVSKVPRPGASTWPTRNRHVRGGQATETQFQYRPPQSGHVDNNFAEGATLADTSQCGGNLVEGERTVDVDADVPGHA